MPSLITEAQALMRPVAPEQRQYLIGRIDYRNDIAYDATSDDSWRSGWLSAWREAGKPKQGAPLRAWAS